MGSKLSWQHKLYLRNPQAIILSLQFVLPQLFNEVKAIGDHYCGTQVGKLTDKAFKQIHSSSINTKTICMDRNTLEPKYQLKRTKSHYLLYEKEWMKNPKQCSMATRNLLHRLAEEHMNSLPPIRILDWVNKTKSQGFLNFVLPSYYFFP